MVPNGADEASSRVGCKRARRGMKGFEGALPHVDDVSAIGLVQLEDPSVIRGDLHARTRPRAQSEFIELS